MTKKLPQRTCLGCYNVRPKRNMIRMVRGADGKVELDLTGKKAGRGAYVCPNADCLKQMISKGRLRKALGVEPPPNLILELEHLIKHVEESLK